MNGIKKTSIGISIAFATLGVLAGREGLATRTSEKIKRQVTTAVGKDSSDVFFKSSLIPADSQNTYLMQVKDSALGKKYTPDLTFKMPERLQAEAARLNGQADSVMDEAVNLIGHADQLRNLARDVARTK